MDATNNGAKTMTATEIVELLNTVRRQQQAEKRSAAAKKGAANRKPAWIVFVADPDTTDRPDLAQTFGRRADADRYAAECNRDGFPAFVAPNK